MKKLSKGIPAFEKMTKRADVTPVYSQYTSKDKIFLRGFI